MFWKKAKASKPRPAAPRPRAPGVLSRAASGLSSATGALRSGSRVLVRVSLVVMFLGLAGGWLFGKPALERYVASLGGGPLEVRFNWPAGAASAGTKTHKPGETWLPLAVQEDLVRAARDGLSLDPFDRAGLERARATLDATGWFARIRSIHRAPAGHVTIDAEWRVPAGLVQHKGREYLVARGGEILRLPPRTPVAKGSMPLIMNPMKGPPTDGVGIVYGKAWNAGDVQAAIGLLGRLQGAPEFKRIIGVDLSDYMKTSHLTLVTDAGSTIVWGSAVDDVGPGEATFEKRRGRLRDILAQRIDASQHRIEIFTPVVMVDKTVSRE